MKFRPLLAACFAGIAFSAAAQTDGVEYYKADQFGNAKELLLRTADKPGTDMAVTDYYLGLIALEEEKTAEASSYFEKGVQANADNPYNYVGLAQVALLKGDRIGRRCQQIRSELQRTARRNLLHGEKQDYRLLQIHPFPYR